MHGSSATCSRRNQDSRIPQVIEEYSKNRVLTQERVCGRNVMAAGQPDASRTAALGRREGQKTPNRQSKGRRSGASSHIEGRTTVAGRRPTKARQAAVSHSIARFVTRTRVRARRLLRRPASG